jgi:pyridoxine 5-phosphate synthase
VTRLSININKIATLRNARGGNRPDVVQAAIDCEQFGAEGITVHPRPDERHIRYADVRALSKVVKNEFNIEGYPSDDFIELVKSVRPQQVTLVPDAPDVITSNAGWDCKKNAGLLKAVIQDFKNQGIRVSIFLDPNVEQVRYAAETGTDRIELYTEAYASTYPVNRERAIEPYAVAAQEAHKMGLGVNAGHDLDLENLRYLRACIPNLEEVSIGHALICDALYYGLQNSIQMYLQQIRLGEN